MDDIPARMIEEMRLALLQLNDDLSQFIDRSGPDPAPGSPAANEQENQRLSGHLATAYAQAHLLLECAADHTSALARILCPPVHSMASWTCVRAAVEAAAFSCWLLDHQISARERVARSLASRYESLREQLKAARTPDSELSSVRAESRLREVEGAADGLGYGTLADKKGRRCGLGTRLPSATECVGEVFRDHSLFRVLSAMVHAQPWAMIQLGFEPALATEPTLLTRSLKPNSAAFLLMVAADTSARPAWARARLFGSDLDTLSAVIERRYSEMGLSATRRFWDNAG